MGKKVLIENFEKAVISLVMAIAVFCATLPVHAQDVKEPVSSILAAKYYTNPDGTQKIDWYLICDPYNNLYISEVSLQLSKCA